MEILVGRADAINYLYRDSFFFLIKFGVILTQNVIIAEY